MAVTKTRFIYSLSNGLNSIAVTSFESFLDIMIKALVSGFGPFALVKITIVDKIATVDLGEICTIFPGMKISLEGTGVPEIDTIHEVDKISGNTFSFPLDTPDAVYTNGLTFSYPSLGWTLLFRSADAIIVKQSNGNNRAFLFSKDSYSPDRAWLKCNFVRNPTSLKDNEGLTPVDESNSKNYIPLWYSSTFTSVNTSFFFYGDNLFVLFGQRANSGPTIYITEKLAYSTLAFGDTVNSQLSKNSAVIIGNGRDHNSLSNSDFFSNTCLGSASFHTEKYVTIYSSLNGETTDFTLSGSYVPNGFIHEWFSGNIRFQVTTKNIVCKFFDVSIFDSGGRYHGEVPGVFSLTNFIGFTAFSLNHKGFYKVDPKGRLENRKCLLFPVYPKGEPYKYSYQTLEHAGSVILDLTGPIR